MKAASSFTRLLDTILVMPVGEWITANEIHAALEKRGHVIHLRSVQRDLVGLEIAMNTIQSRASKCGTPNKLEWRRTKPLE